MEKQVLTILFSALLFAIYFFKIKVVENYIMECDMWIRGK